MSEGTFKFRLRDILVSNFKQIATPQVDPDAGVASIEFSYNFTFDTQADVAICKMHFKYFLATDLKDPNKGQTNVLFADIHFIYQVPELVGLIREQNGKQSLENGVLVTLLHVAYSTSRGILYERTRGYGINNLLLPVLNVREYVNDVTYSSEATASSDIIESPS